MTLAESKFLLALTGFSSLAPIAMVAHAEIYMSQDQATKLIFPGTTFQKQELTLNDEQVKAIENKSGESVRSKNLLVYKGPKKEVVFIDHVLGKHEFITIAVGVTPESKVQSIEVLEYRETYGQQVRNAEWRKQFEGKVKESTLKLGKDVKNITGATLSSAHITAGVKRLLFTYDSIHDTL